MSEAIVHSIVVEEYSDRPKSGFEELQNLTAVNIYPTSDERLDLDAMSEMVEREALSTGIGNFLLEDRRHTFNWGASSFSQEIILMVAQGLSGAAPTALVAYLIHKSRQAKEEMRKQESEQEDTPLDLVEYERLHNRAEVEKAEHEMLTETAISYAQRFGINEEDALVKETDFTENAFIVIESKKSGRRVQVDFEDGQDILRAKRID